MFTWHCELVSQTISEQQVSVDPGIAQATPTPLQAARAEKENATERTGNAMRNASLMRGRTKGLSLFIVVISDVKVVLRLRLWVAKWGEANCSSSQPNVCELTSAPLSRTECRDFST